jgi:hypothetical protein
MSTNADFNFDFEEPKTNRIHAASDSADGFDFDDDFLNDTSTIEPKKSVSEQKDNDISFDFEKEDLPVSPKKDNDFSFELDTEQEPKKSVSEQKDNDISFDFEDNKQKTELDDSFSFDFEKEDSPVSPKKDNDFSFEIDTEQEPKKSDFDIGFETEKSDFDNDFMNSNVENQKEEPKKFDSFDDVEMDEDENIHISKNNDKKFDYSSKNDIIENNDFDNSESNIKKKGFFMAKNKKEDVQEEVFDEEVFDEELEDNNTETEEKPKPIFLQKWFIPTVGGVLFAGFIGVKMMNGGLAGGNLQPVQQLTQQNQQIQQPPAMFEESKPEENALQQPIQSEQTLSVPSEQPPMMDAGQQPQQPPMMDAGQQPSISNSEMIRMAAEQKKLLDEQMQETNLKINNQNIRLDRIENNIGQISNNMVLIANSLTDLKNSFESKQAKADVTATPKLEKDKKEKVKTKETVVSENRDESTSKHFNHYHNTKVTYSKKIEPLYGNVKMAINGSAWVVNSKGETIELRTGDYNSQYGKILSIDENSLIVKTSKGSLHSNY